MVKKELLSMETEILTKNIRILTALDRCSQRIEEILQATDSLGNNVAFGSIGIDGIVQSKANDVIYQQQEQTIVENYRRLFLKKQELLEKLESDKW